MELRKDYILDVWCIINQKRGQRPKEFKATEEEKGSRTDFFAPGNEEMTPPEIDRLEKNGQWQIRVFPNKFPAVHEEGNPEIQTHNDFYTFASAFGKHEVVVEAPESNRQLWDLSEDELLEVFKMYQKRINALYKSENVKYVCVFKNHGQKGGTSILHTHTQIVAFNLLPVRIQSEISASIVDGQCKYCQVIEKESKSERFCYDSEHFVAFAPYASRFNYEVWVFSKEHKKRLNDFAENELRSLASVMHKILAKLRYMGCSYNFFLHEAPPGSDLHFHIEVTPRIATWAGFELSSGVVINSVAPEFAAQYYRN